MTNNIQTLNNLLLDNIKQACLNIGIDTDKLNIPINFAPVPNTANGDLALPCFQFRAKSTTLTPQQANNPSEIAKLLAQQLNNSNIINTPEPTGPYLNITFKTNALANAVISEILTLKEQFPQLPINDEHVVIEFSSPNTNKPIHLGHTRNNVLGESLARILSKTHKKLTKVNLINDRGIHICKSMLAYMKWGNNTTPESTNKKADHFIGDYYVLFENNFRKEYNQWLETTEAQKIYNDWTNDETNQKILKTLKPEEYFNAFKNEYKDTYFNTKSQLGTQAAQLLIKWENNDTDTIKLWKQLNNWVLEGFEETYKNYGIEFDKIYYESNTYKLGRDIVEKALQDGLCNIIENGAIAFPLEKIGLEGQKVLIRSNNTTVYMTQDLGTAIARYDELKYNHMIYVVADEQNHHFKLLFSILETIRPDLKNHFEHLSYGMVLLPHGRMKSREGTVVDADELLIEMTQLVEDHIETKNDSTHYTDIDQNEKHQRATAIALAALKYYLLDITPPSSLEFNPEKSIDLQGRTGAYCLMNYCRTRSILRKSGLEHAQLNNDHLNKLSTTQEHKILLLLREYPNILQWAAQTRDPSKIAEYLFNLSKAFAFFFTDKTNHSILNCEDPELQNARLMLVDAIGITLKSGLNLLGIETIEAM